MPEGNEDAYKEMYEMGERLMQMAKDGGYSPDSVESEDTEETPAFEAKGGDSDKVGAALKMFGNG